MIAKTIVLCALVGAIASVSSGELLGRALVKSFNEYLEQQLPDNTNVADNLALAQKADPSLKPAFDSMAALANAKGCDKNVLNALGLFGGLKRVGHSRVHELLRQTVPKISTKACVDALEREFRATASFGDSSIQALIQRFKESGESYFKKFNHQEVDGLFFQRYLSDPEFFDRPSIERTFANVISSDVKSLAKGDPKARIYEIVTNPVTKKHEHPLFTENFKYAFETYLLEPCKKYTEKTWNMFENFYGVSKLLRDPLNTEGFEDKIKWTIRYREVSKFGSIGERVRLSQGLSAYMPEDFQAGLFTYRRCLLIESYSEETVNESFRTSYLRDF